MLPPALASDLARALDPAQLMTDAGLPPDPWQADLLRSTSKRHLVLCSRQSGKSTTTAALAVHSAVFDPGLVLLVAPSQRQSGELFKKVLEIHRALDGVPKIRSESALRLELENGSRIVALPGTEATVRGFSGAKLVILDEASRVPDELFAAIRPTLATTQGRLVALTTPFGRRGWFFEAWESGNAWTRTRITAEQCPRIDDEWLAEERRTVGDWVFDQEYRCLFLDSGEQLFNSELIEAALDPEVLPLWPN